MWCVGGAVCGCAPAPAPQAPSAEPSAAPSAAASVAPSASALNGFRLEALPVAAASASSAPLSFEEPLLGDVLDAKAARSKPVRLRASAQSEVLLSLDGRRPRRFRSDRAWALSDLVSPDEELSVGQHLLLAVPLASDGRALRAPGAALVGFFVGVRPTTLGPFPPPSLFCLSPSGTSYGPAEEPLLLDVLGFGLADSRATLHILAAGRAAELPFELSSAQRLYGVPHGDVRLRLAVTGGPSTECVVTRNPAPPEARP
ncbi:MAG: hypothetical protein QM756_44985 [Polyangiaceae bacterium]